VITLATLQAKAAAQEISLQADQPCQMCVWVGRCPAIKPLTPQEFEVAVKAIARWVTEGSWWLLGFIPNAIHEETLELSVAGWQGCGCDHGQQEQGCASASELYYTVTQATQSKASSRYFRISGADHTLMTICRGKTRLGNMR
jgi:hypothetical protein